MRTRASSTPWIPLLALLALSLTGLAGCGGGGGSGGGARALVLSVDAGVDRESRPGLPVGLSATIVSDGTATVQWTQVSGPTVPINSATSANAVFIAPAVPEGGTESFGFVCTATTASGSASDDILVRVHASDFIVIYYAPDAAAIGLFRLQLATGELSSLSGLGGDTPRHWQVSPDARHVAYLIEPRNPSRGAQMHVARTDGTGSLRVSPPMQDNGRVATEYAWSPDSSRLAFLVDADTDGVDELYTVRPDGTGLSRCHAVLGAGEGVTQFAWAPDSSRIGFVAVIGASPASRLFACLADGTSALEISDTPAAGTSGDVASFLWGPRSSTLAYTGSFTSPGQRELYAASDTGDSHRTLSNPAVSGIIDSYTWAPDASHICYVFGTGLPANYSLHVTLSDGTGNLRVDQPRTATEGVRGNSSRDEPKFAPDSSRILYMSEDVVDGELLRELHTVTPDGVSHSLLSKPITTAGSLFKWAWFRDSTRVIYGRTPGNTFWSFWVATADGANQLEVSQPAATDGLNQDWVFNTDQTEISWRRIDPITGMADMWAVQVDGTNLRQISATPAGTPGVIGRPVWSNMGSFVLYETEVHPPGVPVHESIFRAPADGSSQSDYFPLAPGVFGGLGILTYGR